MGWPSNRMTIREAMDRLSEYRIGIRRYGSLQWQLFRLEDENLEDVRTIDELEECVDVARDMRQDRFLSLARAM